MLLEQARAAIPPLEGQRRAALFALAALTGMTPKELPASVGGCQHPPTIARPLPVGDGAALLRRRRTCARPSASWPPPPIASASPPPTSIPTVTLGGSVSSAAGSLAGLVDPKNIAWAIGSNSSAVRR